LVVVVVGMVVVVVGVVVVAVAVVVVDGATDVVVGTAAGEHPATRRKIAANPRRMDRR
jgi:hypothetical protein